MLRRFLRSGALISAMLMFALSMRADAASKLGVLCLGGDDATTRQLIDTGKLPMLRVNPDSGLIPYYKQRNPNGVVLSSMGGGGGVDYNQDPTQFALNRWNNYLWPALSKLSPTQKALIDYLAVSPNMNEPHTVEEAQWWNTYSDTLLPLAANAGFKPLCFTSGVGGVPTSDSVLRAMLPMFRKAHQYGGGWAYHSYTLHYTKDLSTEIWYSLRYRQVYSFFSREATDLMTMPVLIYEAGVDYLGNPVTDGYAYRGSREKYADWLYWFDQKLTEDPYVPGAALFKIGDNPKSWPSFDLDPMVPWLMSYWQTGSPEWPRPPTVLGICVLSEEHMSSAVREVCTSGMPILYADPSEVRPGGAIQLFKQSNPNGLVIAGMRSALPYPDEPDPAAAATKRFNAAWKVLSSMTSGERAMITWVDASPGPVDIDTTAKASYFSTYMKTLREKFSQNGMRSVIATFSPSTLPADQAGWDMLSTFHDPWYDAGRAGAVMVYQTGVPSYVKSVSAHEDGMLKYRQSYAWLLKYKPWMLWTPMVILVGDGNEMKTVPDAIDQRPTDGLGQFKDWLAWFDAEANKDIDVKGIAVFKVGASYDYPASDLSNLSEWFTGYMSNRTSR